MAGLLARLPWPADALRREDIPQDKLRMIGAGDSQNTPSQLVAIFDDRRMMHWSNVNCVAYAPDGKSVAAGDWDGLILLWDTDTAGIRHILQGHSGEVLSVAFSPDG